MSRWTTPYESHTIHSSLENVQDKIESIEISNISDKSILIEIARLKKVIEYIDKYLKLIDPDINITSLVSNLNTLNQYIANTQGEINNFISGNNITYLHRANNNIDNGLSTLKAFHTLLPKVSGQGIYSMLKKYNETLEDAFSEIDLDSTLNASKNIRNLQKELIDGTEEQESIKSRIDFVVKDTEEKYDKLLEFYNNSLNDIDYDNTTKELIEKAKERIDKDTKEAHDKIIEVSTKVDNLDKFYVKIFGTLNDDNERVEGLKDELEKRLKTLNNFEEEQERIYKETLKQRLKELSEYEIEQQKNHEEILEQKLREITNYEREQQIHNKNLFEQIESLLPHATSAGLAKAYEVEREKFKLPIIIWNSVFIGSLIIMFLTSYFSLENIQGIEDIGKHFFKTLPIIAPLIWLAIFASSRRSENQRLEQEYAHKEALAKSYSSYKKQIDGLKEEDQSLVIKLLDNAIETISKNASETLDKKHGDGTPLQSIVKTFTEEIKNLKG